MPLNSNGRRGWRVLGSVDADDGELRLTVREPRLQIDGPVCEGVRIVTAGELNGYQVVIKKGIERGAFLHLRGEGEIQITGNITGGCVLIEGPATLKIGGVVSRQAHMHLSGCKAASLSRRPEAGVFFVEVGTYRDFNLKVPAQQLIVPKFSAHNQRPRILPGRADATADQIRKRMQPDTCPRCKALAPQLH